MCPAVNLTSNKATRLTPETVSIYLSINQSINQSSYPSLFLLAAPYCPVQFILGQIAEEKKICRSGFHYDEEVDRYHIMSVSISFKRPLATPYSHKFSLFLMFFGLFRFFVQRRLHLVGYPDAGKGAPPPTKYLQGVGACR